MVVYCVTTARKEGRYREPPPTPPGYVGIPIADFAEGHPQLSRKPPDYNVALQRSRMMARRSESEGAPATSPPSHCQPSSKIVNKPQWHKPNEADPRLAIYQAQGVTKDDGKCPKIALFFE